MPHCDLDDLGTDGGKVRFPFSDEARRLVLADRVLAVGRRAVDHAQRDLLLGGWRSDPRCWQMQVLLKNLDPRLGDNAYARSHDEEDEIVRCRSFSYRHLASLLAHADSDYVDEGRATVLHSLVRCPPTLLGLDEAALRANGRRACNRPRHCPYCLSRRVRSIYEDLRCEYRPGSGKVLAALYVTVTEEQLDLGEPLARRHVERVREILGAGLRAEGERLFGFDGGIVTFDLGPGGGGRRAGGRTPRADGPAGRRPLRPPKCLPRPPRRLGRQSR